MTKDEFTIREASESDIPTLVEFMVNLDLHVSGAKRQKLSRKAKKRLQAILTDYIDDDEKFMVVASTADDELVGMGNIEIWHNPNLWVGTDHLTKQSGFIDDLWVEPDYRKSGIMARILNVLIDFAESHGIDELILEYSITNKEAASVWKKMGFTPTGVRAAASAETVRQKLSGG